MENSGKILQVLALICLVGAVIVYCLGRKGSDAPEAGKSWFRRVIEAIPTEKHLDDRGNAYAMEVHALCDLMGRVPEGEIALPEYLGRRECVIQAYITVDKLGNVTTVEFAKKSSAISSGVYDAVQQAALATKFTSPVTAPISQDGLITYVIEKKHR